MAGPHGAARDRAAPGRCFRVRHAASAPNAPVASKGSVGTLLDTSILIDLERARRVFRATEDEVAIAAITASELIQGVLRADAAHRPERESFVEGILSTVPTVPFSLRVARVHASVWAEMSASGRTLDAHDLQIAATAISLGWSLATLDRRHFVNVPGLHLAG